MKRYVFSLFFLSALIISGLTPDSALATSTTCNGGNIKNIRVKTDDASSSKGEGGFTALASASVSFTVPAGQTDDFLVTFAGEWQLSGASSSDDWVELQVRLDGVAMEPHDSPSVMAFCSSEGYAMHSATFCANDVASGSHTIQVFWKVTDTFNDSTLIGWLDDWTLSLLVSN